MIQRVILGFTLTFRRAPGTEYLITACGKFCINAYYDWIVTHISPTSKYKYLSVRGHTVHTLVAKAWIWNPAPDVLTYVDHMDRNTSNNAASNLRWVSPQLNSLNRERALCTKCIRRRGAGKVSVYYKSKVTIDGVRTESTFQNKADAERNTRTWLNEAFAEKYREATAGAAPPRADHLFYWQDRTPLPPPVASPGDGGSSEGGEELSSVPSEC